MRNYVIVTESGGDLPPEWIEKYKIRVLPMHVEMDDRDYLDGSMTIAELCSYYDRTKKVPKTAATSPEQYQRAFAEILSEDPEAVILHICYSKVLTCTYQNAAIASDGNPAIYHIDVKHVSGDLGFVVKKTAELLERRPDIAPEDAVTRIKRYAKAVKFLVVPGNLDYLKVGGRVLNAQFLGASLLGLKPLIELIDGKMISTKKLRGPHKKVVGKMVKEFFERGIMDKKEVILVHAHTLDKEIKDVMEEKLKEHGVEKWHWMPTGCVITSHAGPGGVGIAGMECMEE